MVLISNVIESIELLFYDESSYIEIFLSKT